MSEKKVEKAKEKLQIAQAALEKAKAAVAASEHSDSDSDSDEPDEDLYNDFIDLFEINLKKRKDKMDPNDVLEMQDHFEQVKVLLKTSEHQTPLTRIGLSIRFRYVLNMKVYLWFVEK